MPDPILNAILAMDAYNRGYNPGINFGDDSEAPGTKIGFVTITQSKGDAAAQAISFYAVAYDTSVIDGVDALGNPSTVISYRGTDNPLGSWANWFLDGDVATGWTAGVGALTSQVKAAINFYQAVALALPNADGNFRLANISLTGHSLGGGLAGIVAGTYSQSAMLFDNMPIAPTITSLHDFAAQNTAAHDEIFGAGNVDYDPSFAGISGYFVDGDPLEWARLIDNFGPTRLSTYGAGPTFDDPILNLHNQALQVALLFGQSLADQSWQSAAPHFLSEILNEDVGSSLGWGGRGAGGGSSAGEKMATSIAYSAIDISSDTANGALVFGDTGIRAMFDDANDLGSTLNLVSADPTGVSEAFDSDTIDYIGSILVDFAGALAKAKIERSQEPNRVNGVLDFQQAAGSLSIDLSLDSWIVGGQGYTIPDEDEFLNHVLSNLVDSDDLTDAFSWYQSNTFSSTSEISYLVDSLTFDLNGSVNETNGVWSDNGLNLVLTRDFLGGFVATGTQDFMIVGSKAGENLYGSSGSDIIFGGSGDDELRGGKGDDDLYGGEDSDTASYSGNSKPVTISYNGLDEDPSIKVKDGTGGTDILHSIEKIAGTTGRDIVNIVGQIATGTDLTIDANGGQGANPRDTINLSKSTVGGTVTLDAAGAGTISTGANQVINLLGFHTGLIGSAFADTIEDSSSGDKEIDGGAGDDVISLSGTDGAGLLIGGEGDDTITGGGGHDYLLGGAGSDALVGGDGSDILDGGQGYDELHGGAGSDLLLLNGADQIGSIDVSTELLDGGDGDDKLMIRGGGYSGLSLQGGSGNDIYDVEVLNEDPRPTIKVNSGDGHDELAITMEIGTGFGYEDEWNFQPGTNVNVDFSNWSRDDAEVIWDAVTIGISDNGIDPPTYEMIGDMVVKIKSSGESILMRDVHGTWQPGENFNTIHHNGYTSGDIVFQSALPYFQFSDGYLRSIDGGVNVDMTIGSVAAYDLAQAGYAGGLPPAPQSTGDSGDNFLTGTFGDDTLSGGDGDDNFLASHGSDAIDGGNGSDTLELFGSRNDFTVTQQTGGSFEISDNRGIFGTAVLTSIESLYFISDGTTYQSPDLFGYYGSSGNDTLVGNALANELFGLAGNDILIGGGGNDTLDGGEGDDLVKVDGTSDSYALQYDALAENYLLSSADEFDEPVNVVLKGIEQIAFLGDGTLLDIGNWTLSGTSGNDVLYSGPSRFDLQGLAGNDVLNGNIFDDELDGGDGDDDFNAAGGNDWIDGGDGLDRANFVGSSTDFQTQFNGDGSLSVLDLIGNEGSDTLTNVEKLYFAGDDRTINVSDLGAGGATGGDDTIDGSNGADTLNGLDGNDIINGHGGNDVISGGAGNDVLDGGNGNDYLIGGTGDDLITESEGDDTYEWQLGDGNDLIHTGFGGDGDNTLFFSNLTWEQVAITYSWTTGGSPGFPWIIYDGSDVVIAAPSEELVTLENQRYSADGIDRIRFADGIELDRATYMAMAEFSAGDGNLSAIFDASRLAEAGAAWAPSTAAQFHASMTRYGREGEDGLAGSALREKWVAGIL